MHAYVGVVDVEAVRHQKVNIGLSIKDVTHDEKKRQLVLLHFCHRDYVKCIVDMYLVILTFRFLQTSLVYYDLSIYSVFLTSLDIPPSNYRVI